MTCPDCGAETLVFVVPPDLRAYLPDDRAAAAVCTHCLRVTPEDEAPADLPDFTAISDAFPQDPEAARLVVLVLALVDSIAIYRQELNGLLDRVERAGVDVFLVMDRLAHEPALDPAVDLDRRGRQLEQLV